MFDEAGDGPRKPGVRIEVSETPNGKGLVVLQIRGIQFVKAADSGPHAAMLAAEVEDAFKVLGVQFTPKTVE